MWRARAVTLLNRCGGEPFPARWLCGGAASGRTADPAVHAVDPEEVYPCDAYEDEERRHRRDPEPESKLDESYFPPKSPLESSPELKNSGIGPQIRPIAPQKRKISDKSVEFTCITLDGGGGMDREEQNEDDIEYYEHRKASPLSELEFADTRKPITRATDGTGGEEGGGVIGWKAEQVDSAEDSLRRGTEIFKMNAARGDHDSPQARVLRRSYK